jgi:hypothetical protein
VDGKHIFIEINNNKISKRRSPPHETRRGFFIPFGELSTINTLTFLT